MKVRTGRLATLALCGTLAQTSLLLSPSVRAQEAASSAGSASTQQTVQSTQPVPAIKWPPAHRNLAVDTLGDAKAYFTAPLHWDARDWEFFGGALATIAVAHHYDTQVRTHFDRDSMSPLGPKESGELTDVLPSAALLVGTWGYASLIGNHAGESEAWNMFESSGLSLVSAYALK